MEKKRSAREAQEIHHRARDALGDGLRIGHSHQLVNLRQVRDLGLELRSMNRRIDHVAGEGKMLTRTAHEGIAVNAQLARTSRLPLRLGLQDDADDALARRRVGGGEGIGVDHHDAAGIAFRAARGKGDLRTGASHLGGQIAATVDPDR